LRLGFGQNLKLKAAIALFLLWLGGSALAFYWFFLSHYGVYDQQGLWQQQPLVAAEVQQQLNTMLIPNAPWQAVFVSDSSCSCSSFAKEHLQRIQQRQSTLVVSELTLQQATELGLKVVATPLLLLFQHNQLSYAGPLATDLLCSDNASVLDGIVAGTTRLPGLWLNGESTACRCVL
jgi:hypothetical protein